MRRLLLVFTTMAVMVAMVAVMAAPAFAGGNANMGGGNGHVNNQNGGTFSSQTINQTSQCVSGGADSPFTNSCNNAGSQNMPHV